MAIQQHLDGERNVMVFTVLGSLHFEELRSTLESIYAEREYATRSLFDMREATPGGLSGPEMEALVGLIRSLRAGRAHSRWAIVAGHDVHFGLARMFEAYASKLPVEIHVFRDPDEALDWLEDGSLHAG